MKKRLVSLLLAAVMIVTFFAAVPFYGYAASSYETAVSLSSVALTDWMSAVRGETKITELTIPGTHDSCSRKFNGVSSLVTSIAQTQNKNITEQLDMGVRFLDVRCEVDPDTLSVKTVHGSVDCWNGNDYYYLDFCFQDIYNWLAAHPSETVLVMIKEDDGDVGAPKFTNAIYEYIHGYGQNKYFYGKDYDYTKQWYLGRSVPTLDEVRGKCVLMNRFDRYIQTSGSNASEEESGQKIKYSNQESTSLTSPCYVTDQDWNSGAKYHVQDMYKLSTSDKLSAVQEMLSLGHYRGEYYLNFTSTTTDTLLPNPQNYAKTINPAFLNLTFEKGKPSGIIPMDFVNSDCTRKIIENNEAVSNLVTGTDGNIGYEINRLTGTLTISGTGAMNDYVLDSGKGIISKGTTAPWSDQNKNSLYSGQYNTDIITKIVVSEGVTSIGNYAFYGFDHVTSLALPSSVTAIGDNAIPENVSTDFYSINAKAGNISKETVNPYAGKDLSGGVTLKFRKKSDTDNGWNSSLINFSTGQNADNRYFIIMANGTILFNDGNGGAGGNNGCYFDINASNEVNTSGQGWVEITLSIYKDNSGNHILDYYVNSVLAKSYNLNQICAAGYPNGVSGSDGIFSFLSSPDIRLYYGASFSVYPTMAGTTDTYLDNVALYDYAVSGDKLTALYENTFTDSLGGTAVTGTVDGGYSVYHQTADNDGRAGTVYFPYSGTNESTVNYVNTGVNPFAGANTDDGLTIGFWQRINGNYYDNRESITIAQGSIHEKKYFTIGTDGYIRFNNGNGGSDSSLTSAGLYFDYTTPCSAITKKTWQYITVEITDDYHFKYYVNGRLINDISVTGTSQYAAAGGLMNFLTDASSTLYFGSYTPYWGTPTLSLDNVTCYGKALSDAQVAELYARETGKGALLTNEFSSAPERVSGSNVHIDAFEGKNGVLFIPGGSADGDIKIYVDESETSQRSGIAKGSRITVEYIGSGSLKNWVITDAYGTVNPTDTVYNFDLLSDTTIDVALNVAVTEETDESALNAAVAYGKTFEEEYYLKSSFGPLTSAIETGETVLNSGASQREIDTATEEILSAVYDLIPYLNFHFKGKAGGTAVYSYNDTAAGVSEETVTDASKSLCFRTQITMTATADEGYQFAYWYETKTKRILSYNTEYTLILSSNTDVEARFVSLTSATLTFANESGWIKKTVTKSLAQWSALESLASLYPEVPYQKGYVGGTWENVNESDVLSRLASGEDVTVTPTYTEADLSVPEIPTLTSDEPAAKLFYEFDSGNQVGIFTMTAAFPENIQTEEIGIAFLYGAKENYLLSDTHLSVTNRALTSKFDKEDRSGVYVVDVVKTFVQYNWAARGYITYYDADGVLRIAYTDQINVVN